MRATTILLLGALLAQSVNAYEAGFHEMLSWSAVEYSALKEDPRLLSDLGLPPYVTGTYPNVVGQPMTIFQLVGTGAVWEDGVALDSEFDQLGLGVKRPLNHFFDPQSNNGEGRPLTFAGIELGVESYRWALEPWQEESSHYEQLFSLREFNRQFVNAMLGQTPAVRDQSAGWMFQALGHVIHHLQDMAQPQHTRNGRHMTSPANFYEAYTSYKFDSYSELASFLSSQFGYQGGSLPVGRFFVSALEFWTTPGGMSGMADFTAKNFVATDSTYASRADGSIVVRQDFPLPDANVTRQVVTETITDESHETYVEQATYLLKGIRDGYTGAMNIVPTKLAAISSLGEHIEFLYANGRPISEHAPAPTVVNSAVFDERYPSLLPRAVAFSAGLIDFAFRGKIRIEREPDGLGWRITNRMSAGGSGGDGSLTGEFRIAYEAPDGLRHLPPQGTFFGRLDAHSSTIIHIPEPPEDTEKMIVVFDGQIGVPRGDFIAGADGVAAMVIPYELPEDESIACGTPIAESGSSEGVNIPVIELGTTPGEVQLEFVTDSIPDAIRLIANNAVGTELVDSGFVSGYHLYSFNYDHEVLGTTTVRMSVDGNSDTNTLWHATLGCPGQVIDNDLRPTPMVPVTFIFGGGSETTSTGGFCSFSLYIDGQYRLAISTSLSATRINMSLVAGMHTYTYLDKSCRPFRNGGPFASSYVDDFGIHPLVNVYYGPGNSGQFTVSEPL